MSPNLFGGICNTVPLHCSSLVCRASFRWSDLDHNIERAGDELERMGDKEAEFEVAIKSFEKDITTSTTSLDELLSIRYAESEAFEMLKQSITFNNKSKDFIIQYKLKYENMLSAAVAT